MGRFIVIEGIDGTGKTTQVDLLARYLEAKGRKIFKTMEPSPSEIKDFIRKELAEGKLGPRALQLMFTADRAQHIEKEIEPALAQDNDVICDRYFLSTIVYANASGIDKKFVKILEKLNQTYRIPDATIILDMDPKEIAASGRLGDGRKEADGSQKGKEIFDSLKIATRRKMRKNYLKLAKKYPNCHVVDANGTVEEVARRVQQAVG